MLESPQDESVVRWGNEGDSFVVLEACGRQIMGRMKYPNTAIERKVYETYTAETLQTQQFCKLRPATEQIRLSQSAAQQRRRWNIAIRRRSMFLSRYMDACV